VRRIVLATVAVLAAVLVQVTVLNNVPFPGGSGPDLVLVVVVAMALAAGPRDGAIIGFAAGLALDIAPPAGNLLGQSALVFCLVGYGCGRLRLALERSAWLPLAGVALGAAAGEVLYALTGLIFGDPDVTWQAVRQVLPAAVTYDLLLSPFVLYAVALVGGYARWGTDSAPGGLLTGRELASAGAGLLAGAASGAVRDTGAGRSPRLRAAAGHRADGWIGRGREQPGQRAGAWVDRRRPLRLRLRGGVAGSAAAAQPGKSAAPRPLATVRLRLGTPRRRDGAIVARRYLAPSGAAFDGRPASRGGGRQARLRGGALSGGPSALGQSRGRKQREPRLKLGSKRRGEGPAGGRFGLGIWAARAARRRRMGRGSFASGSAARAAGAGGRPAAAPQFRSRSHKPPAALRTAAPRFRRPGARWKRAGRALTGSRGGGPGLRAPRLRATRWRRRFSRPGKGGWR
jgi:rod shape-determining protein MreD